MKLRTFASGYDSVVYKRLMVPLTQLERPGTEAKLLCERTKGYQGSQELRDKDLREITS